MDATTRLTGPMFDGSFNRRVDDLLADLVETPGRTTVDLVRANLDRTLRNPTGAYRSRVTLEARAAFARVSDNNAVYGPWLERGRPGTRFRGYANWRRSVQEIERQIVPIADRVVRQHVGKLGG